MRRQKITVAKKNLGKAEGKAIFGLDEFCGEISSFRQIPAF
jgi:hypothetical protein